MSGAPVESPWSSLTASLNYTPPPLGERASPCDGCFSACCWVVQLLQSVPLTFTEFDFLRFCAGFERIEVGVNPAGTWVVNYRAPCRHLKADFKCELHGSPEKPLVCQRYDENHCMYRHAFLGPASQQYLRMDLGRLDRFLSLVTFDAVGRVHTIPEREALLAALADVPPPAPRPKAAAIPGRRLAGGARWDRERLRPTAQLPTPEERPLTFAETAASPCVRCAAPCCQVLVFDHQTPESVNAVDFMEYMLGFPGLELALTDAGWKTVVHSTCQHFDLERLACGIWTDPSRPAICGSYDAHKCAYRNWLMEPQQTRFVRLDHAAFQRVRRHFAYGPDGEVLVTMSVAQLEAILVVVAPPSPLPPAGLDEALL